MEPIIALSKISQTIRLHITCFHMWVLDYIHITHTYNTKVGVPIREKEGDWYHE